MQLAVLNSKLTRDSKCIPKFSSSHCMFQIWILGKTISNAKKVGIYQIKAKDAQKAPSHHVDSSTINVSGSPFSHSNKDGTTMLWHFHPGHPNFMYLLKLLPSLFINKNPKSFQYDVFICKNSVVTPVNFKNTNHLILYQSSIVIFGDHLRFQILLVQDGFYPFSLITSESLGYSLWKTNWSSGSCSKCYILWLKANFETKIRFSGLIMPKSTSS